MAHFSWGGTIRNPAVSKRCPAGGSVTFGMAQPRRPVRACQLVRDAGEAGQQRVQRRLVEGAVDHLRCLHPPDMGRRGLDFELGGQRPLCWGGGV